MRVVRSVTFCTLGIVLILTGRPRLTAQGAATDPALLAPLRWRSIGPANTGGRIDDIAVGRVAGLPDAIYVATASGGIFKSTNQGTTWTPVFDRVDAMMSIGDVAVAPSNAGIVWAGTGEANNRQSSSWGDGVYKSTDSGRTWTAAGLRDTRHIARVIVHPSNSDIVYVAAAGHLWGPNSERGVFKTLDGGRTWEKVLFVDDNTGATDLAIDPANPQVLYAAMYQRQRAAWGFNGGGPGSGIFRTRDGGATWTRLTQGLPAGDKGRIGLDVSRAVAHTVYAVVEAAGRESGVYRSADDGDTWEQTSTLNPRPMYYSQIRLDPREPRRVYLLGSNRGFHISDDAGASFRDVFSTIHSEDHALWIDPDDTNHLIVGGDGGVSISWDRGGSWLFRDNLPIGQFYEISADMQDPYTICGGLQDNGHWCVPSATRNRNGISNADAFNIGSGDGFYARIDPRDPQTVVVESQDGRANRVNLATFERQPITPLPPERAKRGDRERWNWDTPIAMSSFDPKVLYMGSNMVFRSTDRGATWKAISPDLTEHLNRETLRLMGALVPERALSRHDGQSSFSTLTTIGESPLDANVLYTGSDDGQLYATRDGGRKWTNLTGKIAGVPAGTYVSSVLPSAHAAGRVYATFDGHFNDDYHAYVCVSDDFGQSWKLIAAGLPATSVNRLREHPRNARLLFAGHERGVHFPVDGGATWASLTLNMPNVPVDDLLIHPRENDLIAGTHGRGIWVLDNIGALEALAGNAMTTDAYLVPPARARLLSIYAPQAWFGGGQFFAPNPDFGATIDYFLRAPSADEIEIALIDAANQVVRTLKGSARAGLNRLSWDLRMEPPLADANRESPAAGGSGNTPVGPLVLPGTYTVHVRSANRPAAMRPLDLKAPLRVEADPRVTFTPADRLSRQTLLLDLYELQKTLSSARAVSRTAASQLDARRADGLPRQSANGATAGLPRQSATGATAGEKQKWDATTRLSLIQADATTQINTTAGLSRAIEGYSGLPTADQRRQIDWAFEDARKTIDELNETIRAEAVPGNVRLSVPARR